jgi:RNA polymerase sigma-70 factor (ECF subfamily)
MTSAQIQPTDAELLEAYLRGNERSFELLVERHLPAMYRFFVRMTGDQAVAEDLAQETFLKVWRHIKRFDRTKSFTTWLYTIARNTVLDFFKKKRAIPFSEIDAEAGEGEAFAETLADESPLASVLLEKKEAGEEVQAALEKLPTAQRMAILLHDGDGLTFREIADVTDEPLDTVKSRYRRGVLALKKAFLSPAAKASTEPS